jgi:Protein of unknown function (DUF3352)
MATEPGAPPEPPNPPSPPTPAYAALPPYPPTQSIADASSPPAAAAPVQPVTVARGKRPSVRWAVALVIVALVVATASAAFIALAGAGAPSTVASWAPAETAVYGEARFDLPGDQRAKLAEFLSAFPGFADQSALEPKLDELYDRIVRDASSGADYSTQIEPWFGGQLAFAAPAPPAIAPDSGMPSGHVALIATVKDAARAQAWLAGLAKSSTSGAATTATYGGVTLTVGGSSGSQYAYGIDGPILVAGDVATVHAVIDTKGSTGLASTTDYRAALAAFQGDHLAFFFADTGRLVSSLSPALGSGSSSCGLGSAAGLSWSATAIRAESDHLLADAAMPAPAGTASAKDRLSTLAPRLPATTIAVAEKHDLGATIKAFVAKLQADPACAAAMKDVTAALDKIGGLDSFLSWIGDSAVVVTKDGSAFGGGVVVALPDAAAADTAAGKLASIKNLATLSGAAKVSTEDHGGATITTVTLGDLTSLLPSSAAGAAGALKSVDASLSYTIHDGLVIVGVGGDAFVKAVLDTKAGSSLADQSRYRTALDRAGAENTASAYLDVQSVLGAVEAALSAADRTKFDTDTKPYLVPLQAIAVSQQSGDVIHGRFVITVAK